ncbi:MAG: PEP-CTERM sorting domain-containing protein [Phycisphaerales bacterium]|nr:PEP-CTERM sorting domain-containing protein [Phycisphaerales bacterium]
MVRSKSGVAGLCLAGVVGLCAGSALADRIDLFVYENADNADIGGLDLWADLVDGGTFIDITFYNDSTAPAVVTSVYFEAFAGLTGGSIVFESVGVNFSDGATPGNPAQPGFSYGGSWGGNLYSAGAESPRPVNGINEGGTESLTIRFDYVGGTTFGDVKAALTSGGPDWRIAQHVQGVGDNAEFSVWSITVPAPGSLALVGLAGLAGIRRRR